MRRKMVETSAFLRLSPFPSLSLSHPPHVSVVMMPTAPSPHSAALNTSALLVALASMI